MKTAAMLGPIKKNAFSISCAVIALLAIGATFWPVGKMFDELRASSDARAQVYQQLEGLLTKPRTLPLTDPSKTEPDDLKAFPNKKTIDLGQTVTQDVSKQSVDMVNLVVALNQKSHDLLVADALPDPLSGTPRFRFEQLYKLVLSIDPTESIETDPLLKEAKIENLRNDVLDGGMPPTDTDITANKDLRKRTIFDPRIITANGQAINQVEIDQERAADEAALPDVMRMQVARTKKIYVANDALPMNPNVIGVNAPNSVDIWNAQMTLWIQEDVARAIQEANAKATCILDAPVKHLISLSIPPTLYVTASPQGGGTPPPPAPVDGADSQPLPKVYTASPAGRVSNPLYDVVQFQLTINVDASQVPAVLAALCRNRLLDVYSMNVLAVDLDDWRQRGYIYGTEPVVQLVLQCEELFMRRWTAPLMPAVVKSQLGVQLGPPPGAAGAPQAQAQ